MMVQVVRLCIAVQYLDRSPEIYWDLGSITRTRRTTVPTTLSARVRART